MRRSVRFLSLVLPLTLAVACGKKKDSDSAEPPPPADDPGPAAPANPESPASPQSPAADPYASLYEPTNVPAQFSVALPGAILIDSGGGLRLEGEEELPPEQAPDAQQGDQNS